MFEASGRRFLGNMVLALFCSVLWMGGQAVEAAEEYQSVTEAWNAGMAALRSGNYAASQQPLEAALELTPEKDTKQQIRIHDALLRSYRLLPEPEKFIEASEFIISHTDSTAKQSLTRGALLSFMFQRGKINQLIERYESKLSQDKEDYLSLYLLSEIYSRYQKDPDKAITYTQMLGEVQRKTGEDLSARQMQELASQYAKAKEYQQAAELFEKAAAADERTASWNWKEAVGAWISADQTANALKAIKQAEALGPDTRSEQLTYFWHKTMGDNYLMLKQPDKALSHFEIALTKTAIEGYQKSCRECIATAKEQIAKQ